MKYWGKATSVDLYNCKPETIRDRDAISESVKKLCELIEMRRFGETKIVMFGDDPRVTGYSMTQLIETSLISGHFAEQSNAAYIDIFSCKDYDENQAADFLQDFYGAKSKILHVTMRR